MEEGNIFYQRVLGLSKSKGKSLNSIERELSFPRNALHNYKNGTSPRADRVLKVSHYFDVEPEYLLGEISNSDWKLVDKMFEDLEFQEKLYISQKSIDWLYNNKHLLKSEKFIDIKKNGK